MKYRMWRNIQIGWLRVDVALVPSDEEPTTKNLLIPLEFWMNTDGDEFVRVRHGRVFRCVGDNWEDVSE